jgi:Na+-translocating ferredoxin:NAD+ oxidoreductase RnfG subunit
MYLYQTRFGSLYLHIGLISSLFMVGLTAGALLISTLLAPQSAARNKVLLFAVISVHTLILVAIAFWPFAEWTQSPNTSLRVWEGSHFAIHYGMGPEPTHLAFGAAFVLCGLCAGCYFPLAIVPVLGARLTLFVFILLILANLPPAALAIPKLKRRLALAPAGFSLRGLGYGLFAIGLSVVVCSNLLVAAGARLSPSLPQYAAQALVGQARLEQASAMFGDRNVNYFKVHETKETQERLAGYVFSSQDLAPEVRGFGGRMNLAVHVDTAGKLVDFHIIRSSETPAYLELLSQWQDLLKARCLFRPQPFADVHAVTGATISSEAILSALQSSGQRFAAQILGRPLQPPTEQMPYPAGYLPDRAALYLLGAFLLTLIVIYRGGFWSRLAVLLFNLVAGGIILNTQYSTEQIVTALSLHAPAVKLSGAFLLAVGIPLFVLMFGNIYCGYICPFGAAQELLGYLVPARFKPPLPYEQMRKARFIKYIVLFVLVIVFFFSRDRSTLTADPLISIFNLRFSIYNLRSVILWIGGIALLGSVLYPRFWCRYLCPAGAFLSLFNNVAILKRLLPAKKFDRCEFGLTPKDRMDCIYCDRCRYEPAAVPRYRRLPRRDYAPAPVLSRYLVAGVLIAAAFLSSVSVKRFLQVIPTDFGYPAVSSVSGGEPRDVDLQRIRTMIRQKKLSDHEAQFYKEIE